MKRMVIAFGCDDMEYRTTVEMSKKWGISERRIARLCAEKRINGVMKIGRAWAIPDNAKKPSDARIHTGKYCKRCSETGNYPVVRQLPELINQVFELI